MKIGNRIFPLNLKIILYFDLPCLSHCAIRGRRLLVQPKGCIYILLGSSWIELTTAIANIWGLKDTQLTGFCIWVK